MQEIPTYNHPKPKDSSANKVSIFYTAAKISLLGPILCALLVRGALYGLKDMHSARLALSLGGITVVGNVICFALGLFALFGVVRYGTHGVLVRAVLGLLLSGLSLGCFGAGFVRGFQAALKQYELTARARVAPDQSGNGTDKGVAGPGESTNSVTSPEPAASTPGDKAAKNSPGDMSVVEAALAACKEERQSLITTYEAASLAMKNPPVLSMKDVAQHEQLIARIKLVNRFLDANEKLLGSTTKAEVSLREEMVRQHANTATVDAGLKEYQQSIADRDFALMRVRAMDQRIGKDTLNMLTILEANWGSWSYNAEKNTLSFRNSAIAAQYNDNFADLSDAKTEQTRLKADLPHQTEAASPPAKPSL